MQDTSNQLTPEQGKVIMADSGAHLLAYMATLGALREQYTLIKDKVVFQDKMVLNRAHRSLNQLFRQFDKMAPKDELYKSMLAHHMEVMNSHFAQLKGLMLDESAEKV